MAKRQQRKGPKNFNGVRATDMGNRDNFAIYPLANPLRTRSSVIELLLSATRVCLFTGQQKDELNRDAGRDIGY